MRLKPLGPQRELDAAKAARTGMQLVAAKAAHRDLDMLDLTKRLVTSHSPEGWPARIVARSKNLRFPLGVIVTKPSGEETEVLSYTSEGLFHGSGKSDFDLRNASQKKRGFVGVFAIDGETVVGERVFPTYGEAQACLLEGGAKGLLGVGELVWEEGDEL